ncbi:major facilitator superfamily transporter [Purpureocillium lavendulum]|uniref:Major facilitator superfamily transporter n=1 Tax=Purpureocillium lavendulum TaxID=1247861 RepID=A0AB34FTD2_9HYPO|nr:major facilitator superfamily transporter [Purpureocillium lavendulum]
MGIVGFLAPGLWNAMNALGAGGAQEPFLINAANALVFGLMGFLCLFGVGYPIYSAGLYTNNRFGNPAKRGKYMNIWLWFRTGGPLLGGVIVLALNHSAAAKKKGKVDSQTYLIFVALQCLAAPVALLLSPPDKVQRTDGSKVIVRAEKSLKAEFAALWRASLRKDILLLLPVFWASYFNQYSGNFQTYYFGLMSMLLDYKKLPVQRRIVIGFWYAVVWHVIAWVYGWVIQEKYTANPPAWDWEDSGFVEGFFVLLLWDFARQSLQNWLYYFLATKTDNISELSRFCGILRGQESFAQAVSFGLNTRKWHGGRVPLAVNTILLVELHASETVEQLFDFILAQGNTDYLGEKYGSDKEVILGALLHDVGRFIPAANSMPKMIAPNGTYVGRASHEVLGESYLRQLGFSEKVCQLVGAHVMAKRYLTAVDKDYYDGLSDTSKRTLKYQGGIFNQDQVKEAQNDPLLDAKLAVRRWDDEAKVPGRVVPGLMEYMNIAIECLIGTPLDIVSTSDTINMPSHGDQDL